MSSAIPRSVAPGEIAPPEGSRASHRAPSTRRSYPVSGPERVRSSSRMMPIRAPRLGRAASEGADGGGRGAASAHGRLPISAWAVPVSVQRRSTAQPLMVRRSSTISASARSLFIQVAEAPSGSWYSTATLRSAGWATRTRRRRRPERTVTSQPGSPRWAEPPSAASSRIAASRRRRGAGERTVEEVVDAGQDGATPRPPPRARPRRRGRRGANPALGVAMTVDTCRATGRSVELQGAPVHGDRAPERRGWCRNDLGRGEQLAPRCRPRERVEGAGGRPRRSVPMSRRPPCPTGVRARPPRRPPRTTDPRRAARDRTGPARGDRRGEHSQPAVSAWRAAIARGT